MYPACLSLGPCVCIDASRFLTKRSFEIGRMAIVRVRCPLRSMVGLEASEADSHGMMARIPLNRGKLFPLSRVFSDQGLLPSHHRSHQQPATFRSTQHHRVARPSFTHSIGPQLSQPCLHEDAQLATRCLGRSGPSMASPAP